MKKLTILLMSALAVCISCVKEEAGQMGTEEGITISFQASAPSDVESVGLGTKTSMSVIAGGYSVLWNTGDAISVNGKKSTSMTIDPSDPKSATFVVDGINYPCSAVYPSALASDFNAGKAVVTLPAKQTYREGSFDPAAAVMLGYVAEDGQSLDFSHAMSYLFIIAKDVDGFDSDEIESVTVSSLGSEPMSGKFNASFSADGCAMTPAVGNIGTDVTLDCGSGIEKGTPVVVAIPSGIYSSGIAVTVTDVYGDVVNLQAAKELTFAPGKVYAASLRVAAPGIYNTAGFTAFAKAVNEGDYDRFIGEDDEVNLYADITSAGSFPNIEEFDGVFDGNGHMIKINGKYRPFFQNILADGVVKNLTAEGTYTKLEAQGEGAFANFARVNLGTIENCVNNVSGAIETDAAIAFGGFVGQNGGIIKDCVNNGDIMVTVTTNSVVCYGGGFAAWGNTVTGGAPTSSSVPGKFINCVNNADVIVSVTSGGRLTKTGFGGICGVVMLNGVEFDRCVNSETAKVHRIDVTGSAGNNVCASAVGGILGRSAAVFTNNNSYVDMDSTVGGYNTVFTDCSNSGEVINSVRNGNNFGDDEKGNTKCGTGGIVGSLVGKGSNIPSLVRCANHGTVKAGYNAENNSHIVGGLVGMARLATFTDCISSGKLANYETYITGPVGGFVGFALDGVNITGGAAKPQISIIKKTVSKWSYGLVAGTTRTSNLTVSNVRLGGSIKVDGTEQVTSSNCQDYIRKTMHFTSTTPSFTNNTWEGAAGTSLTFSSFADLNKGSQAMNSHQDETGRSHLHLMYNDLVDVDCSGTGPRYPRISQRNDGGYIMTWQNGDGGNNNGADTYYALSNDLESWAFKGALFARSGNQFQTNANVKLLKDGRLMAVSSFWNKDYYSRSGVDKNDEFPTDSEGKAANEQHGIRIKFSSDNGRNWTPSQVVYNGPNWECHIMEPTAGHIQIYFAESRPRISDSHSGTSMIESKDNGVTWTPTLGNKAFRVMRKLWVDASNRGGVQKKFTYQMPVGVILNGSSQMAFALECVEGSIGKLDHKVAVVHSSADGKWNDLQGDETTPAANRQDDLASGIGPCLVQFPSGETVLSYAAEKRPNTIYHKIGNADASGFGAERVLMQNLSSAAWSSVMVDGGHTLVAVDRNVSGDAEDATITLARFALNHSITSSSRNVTVDASSSEWDNTDEALFLGASSQANAVIRCSDDASNLYFLIEVKDKSLHSSDKITLDLGTSQKVVLNARGLVGEVSGVSCAVAYDGELDSSATSKGYVAEVQVKKSSFGISSGNLLFNAHLYESSTGTEDSISDSVSSQDWVYIKGL
ncbi:MAG: exo-alpha-sialidase [Bacteroidales bacterium]|nr:exo-alpha-sialidase [Bacteroidales bacterium]